MSYTNTLRVRGVCKGQGLRLFVFFREKERQARRRGALKSFSFLTRQYFMTSAKGGSCWQRGGGSEGEGCLTLGFAVGEGGGVGRAVGRGNTLAHCRIMPLKNSFISCLLFTTKQRAAVARPLTLFLTHSFLFLLATTPPSWQPQHFVIYN